MRSLVGWVLLATYATAASGIPLPMPAGSSGSESFPCRGHRCGCSTAEQCWKSCCCYTNGQKLAWAAEHGVPVPEYVATAAGLEASRADDAPACCRAKRGCCSNSASARCATSTSSAASTPGARSAHGEGEAAACGDSAAGEPRVVYISIVESQRCRGTTPTWGSVAISLPPAPPQAAPGFDRRASRLPIVPERDAPAAFLSPVVPPPRDA